MADELLDLVDENDEVIGTVWKSEAHKNPALIHREADITVFTKDGHVLLQQRAMIKSSPGEWKNTATGHVGVGENPEDAIKREVMEELGIKVIPQYLKKFYDKEENEAKFYWVYYAIAKKINKFKLDQSEVMNAQWVKVDTLSLFKESNKMNLRDIEYIKNIWKEVEKYVI